MKYGSLARISSLFLITSIFLSISAPLSIAENLLWGNQWTGPWIDTILYKPNDSDVHNVRALIEGDVDIIGGHILPQFIDELSDTEDIEILEVLRFGYGITQINCAKYPMNLTNFRRAVAFALDKHRIIDEGWLGYADLLDSHIPRQHSACIDEEMAYHYYDEDIEKGIDLLTSAGFADTDNDGWLEGPSILGPGTIKLDPIQVETTTGFPRDVIVDVVVHAMKALGIPAEYKMSSFEDYRARLFYHGDYDMIFHGETWSTQDLDFYALDHMSENINKPYHNLPNWSNDTWDDLAQIVLHSTHWDEIINTAKSMEHIWVHSCPALIMYQNVQFTAHRTDRFEGITPSIFSGSPNFFTNLRVHRKEEAILGGTYIWSVERDTRTFNPLTGAATYIEEILYDPLVRIGPNGNDLLWMCESYSIKVHEDNPDITEGHTRIIVDIIQNATWSDGLPLTAEDFAFTLNFIHDYVPFSGLEDMVACYAPTPFQLFCEFNTETYWHWHNVAYTAAIPPQTWINYTTNYYEYQPDSSSLDDMIVSGPFTPSLWIPGEYIELKQNPEYFRNPRKIIPETAGPVNTTVSTTIMFDEMRFIIGIVAGTIAAGFVIIAGGYLIFQYTAPLKVT